jgi:YegS/Rv2252/BmrU family lipid kinase
MLTFATLMKKRLLFIVNPISGTSDKDSLPGLINKHLDLSRFDYQIKLTEYPGHATEIAKEAQQHFDTVIAVGGDGTVNEVARGLINSDTVMGIIPCGSGNGLARHLLLPLNMKKSICMINQGKIRNLDYGTINGHPFFCTCGMGFDAFIAEEFALAGKRGPVTYVQKVMRDWFKYKPETYEITDERGTRLVTAFLITIGNASEYGNRAYICPKASINDGLLDVTIIKPFKFSAAPRMALQLFRKTLDVNPHVTTYTSKHIHIRRSGPGVVHYDGDPVKAGTDIDVAIHEKGLKVIVNPEVVEKQRL